MDSSDGALIPVLFLVTLLIFLVIGVWQYLRARKAKHDHEHSALGNTTDVPAAASGATPRPKDERIG